MTTQEIVTTYYKAWTTGDHAKARALLADDLKFDGSIDHFQKADDLLRALQGFTQMVTGVNLIAEFFSGDQAMLLYDCVTPTPAGTIRTAEHFIVRDGKIREIKVVFDASELRKLMPH
jgi:ketosteroid isomerase-like protein